MSPHPGWRHSDETRARLSATHFGKRHSPQVRAKISAGQRGKKLGKTISPAHRAAVSAANRGRPFSSQHCDRISEALIVFYERVSPTASTPTPAAESEPTPFSVAAYAAAHGLDGRELRKKLRANGLRAPYTLEQVQQVVGS